MGCLEITQVVVARNPNVRLASGGPLAKWVRYLGVVLIFASYAGLATGTSGLQSASLNLAWDGSADPEVAGYLLYYGMASRSYINPVNVGSATSCTVSGLFPGASYFFAVTAYNDAGVESGFSSEIVYQVPLVQQPRILSAIPIGPSGLQLSWDSSAGSIYRVASKTTLTDADWTDLSGDIIASGSTASWVDMTASGLASRFYRVLLLYEAPEPL